MAILTSRVKGNTVRGYFSGNLLSVMICCSFLATLSASVKSVDSSAVFSTHVNNTKILNEPINPNASDVLPV